jgi:DNA-binding response OmpR family regulator
MISGSRTILLIERNDETRRLLRTDLFDRGYSLLNVSDFEEALIVTGLGGARPELIIIDHSETAEDGLEIGRELKTKAKLDPSVKLISVPSKFDSAFEGTDVEVREGEFACYWADPYQLEELIARLLERKASQ